MFKDNWFIRASSWIRRIVKRTWLEMVSPRMVSAQTLSDEAFLAKFNMKEVLALVKHGDISAAKEALLAHYGSRVTAWPALSSTHNSNVYALSQEELIARAESILEHRFALPGYPEVTLGDKIDWHYNPTPDPRARWTRALHRHAWWPLLALAYAQTGDERYAAKFVTLMLDWVKENPSPTRKDEKNPVWTLMGVGMRCTNWTIAFAMFYDSPAFTDEAKLTMLRSIYDHARFLFLFKTKNNHLLRESNGLAHISIYFPEFQEADLWRQAALTRLDRALPGQVNRDGSHIEMSTGYQWLVVDEFQRIYGLLDTNNLSLPKENLAHWLEKMYHVLAYLIRPDGTFPQINDGFLEDKDALLTKLSHAGEMFNRDDFVYIGTGGRQGACPMDTSVGFNDAGLYVMRSDWTRNARYLLFDAGPYGGHHGHEDKLSIEVFAFGQSFIVDPGSYTYNITDPFRAYFMSSQAHNTVLVDGKSQIRRWQKGSRNPKPAVGNYATWISQPDFDYVFASYSDGYSLFSLKKPTDAEIITDVTHTRRILFVKPDYWVIVDEPQTSTPHSYQVLFHTAPNVVVRTGSEDRIILRTTPEAASLCLIPAEPQNVKVSWLAGSETPIQGWYSPGRNRKTPTPVVIYERENCSSTVITTLLYPCPTGQTGEEVSVKPLAVSGGKGLAFTVTTARGNDYLMFAQDSSLKQFGPYQSEGVVAGIRTNHQGDILTQFEWREGQ